MKRYILSVAIFSLTGCMQDYYRPDTSQLADSDYGSPIAQADAEAAATSFLSTRLKDADSAKFMCQPVEQGVERDALIYGGNTWAGYVLHCGVNAKNSFGAYTGFEPFTFVFHDGSLVRAYQAQGSPLQ
jgi:hypothetical protein